MRLRLNRKSPLPIHVQLKVQLAHLIQAGEWAPGRRLPTVRRLAELLRINRNTASRVFADLEREGYLSCERGRGTFVASRQVGRKRQRTRELLLVLDEALGRARRLGFSAGAFAAALYARAHASSEAARVRRVPVLLVECSRPQLRRFRRELAEALPLRVDALLIRDLERVARRNRGSLERYALIVTTFPHLGGVRRLLGKTARQVAGLRAGHLRLVPGCGGEAPSLRRMLAKKIRALAARGTEIFVDDRRLDRAGIEMLRRKLAGRW